MKKETIYLDNIDLALQMQRSGFDIKCAFKGICGSCTSGKRKGIQEVDVYCLGKYVDAFPAIFIEEQEGDSLYLPTLGEIDLPEDYIVIKNNAGTFQVWRKKIMHSYNSYTTLELYPIHEQGVLLQTQFTTELEARAHAWLWANQNKKND